MTFHLNNGRKIEEKSEINSSTHRRNVLQFEAKFQWDELLIQTFVHIGSFIGVYYFVALKTKLLTCLWSSSFGVTAGAHRLWSHRSFKAKWQLNTLLVLFFTLAGQRDILTWVKDHRVHHKYSETNSDPHNAKRGFLFAHVGWLVLTPHPDVVEKRKQVDVSDLTADKIIMWQKKYYALLFAVITVLLPTFVPVYCWNESVYISFWTCVVSRISLTLNFTFFVNSVAHMFGDKPYDKNISPVENIAVSLAAMGEGFHNYHHVFPFDYKTGEFGGWKGYQYNITTAFIDAFAKFGWAYDRKSATAEMIEKRAQKTGDGSYFLSHEEAHKTSLWGYGDKDINSFDQRILEKISE